MKRKPQIIIGITGLLLLLITTWPFMLFPKQAIRALSDLFDGTAAFGVHAAGILITGFVITLLAFGIGLLVYAVRTSVRHDCPQHNPGNTAILPGLKPGEQQLLRIIFFSFVLGVINIASLFGSCIITFSLFELSPNSPYQIFIEIPAVIGLTATAFCLFMFLLYQVISNFVPVKTNWELFLVYCVTFIWLGMLYTSLQHIFGNELDTFEIFSVSWPVLAATNILTLLTIKQGITILKKNGDKK